VVLLVYEAIYFSFVISSSSFESASPSRSIRQRHFFFFIFLSTSAATSVFSSQSLHTLDRTFENKVKGNDKPKELGFPISLCLLPGVNE
jgi:hypothetical protein